MAAKTGSLSINSENIFPIIKKWLYSDHDIFYRELISNGCDAITKLKKLELMGEFVKPEELEYKIQVTVDSNAKTISVEDNGIGMTAEEVEEYINQIAFSGAQDFLEKYKDKANEDQIIGHFGLGFYSAFMVADRVVIDTLSYKEGAKPVHWESEGGTEFAMDEGDKTGNGTRITLYLNEDSNEFCNEYRAREVIQKYCAFMPVEIFLDNASAEPQYETIEKDELTEKDTIVETVIEEAKTEEKENEDGTKETVEISPRTEKYKILKRPVALNDINPLWNKHPNECTEEEYKEFYRKVFMDFKEPLFWIHLNMDYPFNLKGILYFPKINMEYESLEGTIKLYNNQVFIADNIKEVIPEFLMLLKGVIDCPDLPLNVSRSALQNDGFVKKISDYITKKVADKLSGMCKTDRETYEKYWDDIAPFIKFGCLKDDKFADKMDEYIIFKNLEGKYLTLKDCEERAKEELERYSIIRTVTAVERADVVLVVIDAVEGVTEQDAKIAGIAHERGKGIIIVVNKWDAIEKTDKTIYEYTNKIKMTLSFIPYAEFIFISAATGQRINKLYEIIDMVRENQTLRIATGVLNEIMTEAVALQQPPSDKGKRLKLYYITQVSVKPPTFVIFVNDKELMHFSYTRYLENRIRDAFGFRGTSLKFLVRERKGKEQ